MPSPSSPSTSPAERSGFTLLEVLVSTALMGLLTAAVMQAFMGARKAQGVTVAAETLKDQGQRAMQQILLDLGQSRRLCASQVTAPASEDIGKTYFSAIDDLKGLRQPIPLSMMRFPRTDVNARVGTTLAPSAYGNVLMFLRRDGELAISGVTIKFGSTNTDRLLTPSKPYRLGVYRFVAYYLTGRALPAGAPVINGNWTQTLVLTRFESQPYLERNEAWGFLQRIPDLPTRDSVVASKLTSVNGETIAGAWDSSEPDPTQAFFAYDPSTHEPAMVTGWVRGKRSRAMTVFPSEPYALGTVSFNSGPDYPNFRVGGDRNGQPAFLVPAFAVESPAPTIPFGFEVGITGPQSGRSVLLRLALAARLSAGLNIYGHAHQEIVQVFDN